MNIGFIGVGNMASAIIKGMVKSDFVGVEKIHAYNRTYSKLENFKKEVDINIYSDIKELIEVSDVLVLAIKPQNFNQFLEQYKDIIIKRKPLFISIAAGYSIEQIENHLTSSLSIVRVMPTIAALINESVSSVCPNKQTSQKEIDYILEMFNSIGYTYQIAEKDLSAMVAISGCASAFTLKYIESLATAGLKNGIPKKVATQVAIQSTLASAKLALSSNENINSLIDSITSPKGTTIAGIAKLEEHAFTSSIIQAVDATIKRDMEIKEGK